MPCQYKTPHSVRRARRQIAEQTAALSRSLSSAPVQSSNSTPPSNSSDTFRTSTEIEQTVSVLTSPAPSHPPSLPPSSLTLLPVSVSTGQRTAQA
eukprot:3287287-Rhodomonas_salina.1